MENAITGPLWAARNWSIDAGEGSIHDDSTATDLGFRGGTVAGDVHMNQFVPVLVQMFGDAWFERGNLSLMFKNATVDQERVQVFAEPLAEGAQQTRVWMEREDGLLVNSGTASLGDHTQSELNTRDRRPCDPSELKIYNRLSPGLSLGSYEVEATPERQFELFDAGLISDPLDYYRSGSPWGDVIACPSTLVQQLWGVPMAGLRPLIGDNVGLFGAIEVGQVNGPMVLNRHYLIEGEIVSVGQSPQTEIVWFDTRAKDEDGQIVATMRMMSRAMKASSPEYKTA